MISPVNQSEEEVDRFMDEWRSLSELKDDKEFAKYVEGNSASVWTFFRSYLATAESDIESLTTRQEEMEETNKEFKLINNELLTLNKKLREDLGKVNKQYELLEDRHYQVKTSLQKEIDSLKEQSEEPIKENQPTRRPALPSTQSEKSFRSEKLPDPEEFANGTTHEYRQWRNRMIRKLTINADRYSDEDARIGYAETRLKGEAATAMELHLRYGSPTQISTMEDFWKRMNDRFDDPYAKDNAREKFNRLY